MEDRSQIKNNRQRIRDQLKLNFSKKLSNQSKVSTEPSEKTNSPDIFDHMLNQKCEIHDSFVELFDTFEKLGEGAQSVVKRVVEKKSGEEYASKIIGSADAEKILGIKKQYKLLKALELPSIIKAHYLFISEKESTCRLVLQYCPWPTLQETINRFKLDEDNTAQFAKTLLQTVEYLHSHRVCHRDIKPENILYALEDGLLKLIDFEVSTLERFNDSEMWTVTGSLFYKAPEMFSGSYTNKVDVWAVGIVVFELLHGHSPFARELLKDTIDEICHKEVTEYLRQDLEPFTKDFILKCLAKDPKNRLTAQQALKQPFILRAANKSVTPRQDKLNSSFEQPPVFAERHESWSPSTKGHIQKKISLEVREMRHRSNSSVSDADFGIRLEIKKPNQ